MSDNDAERCSMPRCKRDPNAMKWLGKYPLCEEHWEKICEWRDEGGMTNDEVEKKLRRPVDE